MLLMTTKLFGEDDAVYEKRRSNFLESVESTGKLKRRSQRNSGDQS